MKLDLCCIQRLPSTTMFIAIAFLVDCCSPVWFLHHPQCMLFIPEDIALFSFFRPAEPQELSHLLVLNAYSKWRMQIHSFTVGPT